MGQLSNDLRADRSSSWKELYKAALFERDVSQLTARIVEARRAIQDTEVEVLTSSSSLAEHRAALNKALRVLQILENVVVKSKPAA